MELRAARLYNHSIDPVNSIGQNGDFWAKGPDLYQKINGKYISLAPSSTTGSGEDGNVTVANTVTVTLTKDMYYKDLKVETGGTLKTNGYRIFVSGTLTLSGVIENNGSAAVDAAAGIGAPEGTTGGGGNGGGGGLNLGGAGISAVMPLGGAGGNGGDPGMGAGGIVPPLATLGGREQVQVFSAALADVARAPADRIAGGTGGGGGGGDGAATGGGGGGGGGVVFVVAAAVTVTGGEFRATGGGGGAATGAGVAGGGAGGGGGVILIYTRSSIEAGAFRVNGGTGGTAVGVGLPGSNGADGFYRQVPV